MAAITKWGNKEDWTRSVKYFYCDFHGCGSLHSGPHWTSGGDPSLCDKHFQEVFGTCSTCGEKEHPTTCTSVGHPQGKLKPGFNNTKVSYSENIPCRLCWKYVRPGRTIFIPSGYVSREKEGKTYKQAEEMVCEKCLVMFSMRWNDQDRTWFWREKVKAVDF